MRDHAPGPCIGVNNWDGDFTWARPSSRICRALAGGPWFGRALAFPGRFNSRSRYRSGARNRPRLTGPVGPLASWSAPPRAKTSWSTPVWSIESGATASCTRSGPPSTGWLCSSAGAYRTSPTPTRASHRRAHAALYRGGPRVGPVRSELSLSRPAGAGVRPPWAQAPAAMPRRRSGSHCWTTQSGVWRPRQERAPASRQSFGSVYRPPS